MRRQQPHVGEGLPSQQIARPSEHPHTPLWCEQHPRFSTAPGPAFGSVRPTLAMPIPAATSATADSSFTPRIANLPHGPP
jgi:hypothetical protein